MQAAVINTDQRAAAGPDRIVQGARVNTPMLAWPSESKLREGFAKQGMSEQQIEKAVDKELKERESLRQSALDFERYFFTLMMKEMKKSIKKNEMFHGGRGEEIFDGMLNHEYAKAMVNDRTSLGLARMIEQEMMRAKGGVSMSSADAAKPLSASDTPARQAETHFQSVMDRMGQAGVDTSAIQADVKATLIDAIGEEDTQKLEEQATQRMADTRRALSAQAARLAYADQENLR